MAQIREIKRRIKSINSTAKVTHAMELVAAAKMRKAQEKTLLSRPYTNTLHQIIKELRPYSHKKIHHLLTPKKSDSKMIILITSDRGLVGGLNLNIFRLLQNSSEIKNVSFVTVGKKGLSHISKVSSNVIASFGSEEFPFLDLARTLTKIALDSFTSSEVSSVYIAYPQFDSTIKQTPRIKKLLPIDLAEEAEISTVKAASGEINLLFEPSADKILEGLLPHHVLTRIYQSLLEAKACEHSSRMVSMKNATDAASDLVSDLTLTYNQARQEAITKELLDIITAQSVLE